MDLKSLCDRAVLLQQESKLAEAEPLYRQILAADPGHFQARHLLGLLRYQQNRKAEAAELVAAALCGHPGTPVAWTNYGVILHSLERFEDALGAYDRALALNPDWAPAHGGRGLVLQYLGRLEEARSALARALTLDPARAGDYLHYADTMRVAADDPFLKKMEAMTGLSDADRIQIDFALAKAYADQGDCARSFARLIAGNRLKRAASPYDEAAMMAYFDRIQRVFTPELFRQKQTTDASRLPVFILGMMRSGSTLVEQILASHPDVHGGGELVALGEIARDISYPDGVVGLDRAGLEKLGHIYLDRIRPLAAGARHVTDKMPGNFFFAGLIHLMFPGAAIIHTLRDPLDTCLSCFSKLFTEEQLHTYDLGELGRYYRRYQELMAHWREVLPPGRILDVAYEDVVADLEGQVRRILDYCGLPWDARCLDFHRNRRPVRTASVAQIRQPLYRDAVGRARVYGELLAPLLAALDGR